MPLVNDLKNIMSGTNYDESSWVDVATYAAKTLSKCANVVFMTPAQRAALSNEQAEILEKSGKTLVLVTDSVYGKIENSVSNFDTIFKEYNDSFSYKFVSAEELSPKEKQILGLTNEVKDFLKKKGFKYNIDVRISATIQLGYDGMATRGVYCPSKNVIIIKRSVMNDSTEFCSVLLHEFAHYQHDYGDNTRDFENDLTDMLGHLFMEGIRARADNTDTDANGWFKIKRWLNTLGKNR